MSGRTRAAATKRRSPRLGRLVNTSLRRGWCRGGRTGAETRAFPAETAKEQVGVANVKSRLELHYGNAHCFELKEFPDGEVQAIL